MLPNQAAFLSTIIHSEGTDQWVKGGVLVSPYAVCYGYTHEITNFTDHPAITGEWLGISIANLGPQYAHSISTAAGAFQITRPTWRECKQVLKLASFNRQAQEDAALLLIKERHALDLVNRGAVEEAIAACAGIWASLPGGDSGQPQRKLADLIDVFAAKGGAAA